jgi:uncharacterized protein
MENVGSAPFGLSRETTIVRKADGSWFHDGERIENPKLCRAFDAWIKRAPDGRYCLENDINWAYFTLEGAPFFVRSARIEGSGAALLLSDAKWVELDFRTLRSGPDGALYCTAYPGMPARFDAHAAVQLGDLLDEDEQGPYFVVEGEKIRPPQLDDPLA